MGGAKIAVTDDYSTVLVNPAALAFMETSHTNLSMEGQLSGQQMLNFVNDINRAASATLTPSNRYDGVYSVLQNNYGKQYSFRAGLFEGVTSWPGWGFAFIPADFTTDLKVHNQVTPALSMRTYLDTTLAFGIGRKFKHIDIPGKMSWGLTGKVVHRGYLNRMVQTIDLMRESELFQTSDLRSGYTIDADWGLIYAPIVPTEGLFSAFRLARPTFGIVVRNLAELGFGASLVKREGEAPEKLYRTFDFGMKFEFPSLMIFASRLAIDITDVGHPNFTLRKGSHVGFEFDWRVTSWWKGQYRIGLNQGYLSMGVSALLGAFRLDLASYSEDIGFYSTPVENRLIFIKMNIDI